MILVAFGAGTSASGCSPDPVATVCDLVCFCEGCTPVQQNGCEAKGREGHAQAQERGCDKEFDRNLSCLQEKIRCEGARATRESCFPELDQLNTCLHRTLPGGPVPEGPPPGGTGGE
jgi:hypothetical protein